MLISGLCFVGGVSDVGTERRPFNEIMVWWQSAAGLRIVDFSDRQDDFLLLLPLFLLFFQMKCVSSGRDEQKRLPPAASLPKCVFHFR